MIRLPDFAWFAVETVLSGFTSCSRAASERTAGVVPVAQELTGQSALVVQLAVARVSESPSASTEIARGSAATGTAAAPTRTSVTAATRTRKRVRRGRSGMVCSRVARTGTRSE